MALPKGTSRFRQMASARTGFAVPVKILKRSSFTTRSPPCRVCKLSCVLGPELGLRRQKRQCEDAEDCSQGAPIDYGATLHLRVGDYQPSGADQTAIGIARDGLADKSLIERKPNSGSARLSWARENSKHRRTAPRQQGFCRSVLKQSPLDCSQTGIVPEDRFFEIVEKRTALKAPGKSTEPIKFRVSGTVCQLWCVQPAIGFGRRNMD